MPRPRFNAAVGDQVQIVGDDLLVHCRDILMFERVFVSRPISSEFRWFFATSKKCPTELSYVILSMMSMFRVAWKD